MEKLIAKLAEKIYRSMHNKASKEGKRVVSAEIEKELSGLNPGKDNKVLTEKYYIKKITYLIYLFVGILILILGVIIRSFTNEYLKDDNCLERKTYGENSYIAELVAKEGDEEYRIPIEVHAVRYSKNEAEELMDELGEALNPIILGENEKSSKIQYPLNLPTKVPGYPFDIRWESDNYYLIHEDGSFGEDEPSEEGSEVNLKAIVTYNDLKKEYIYKVVLIPIELTESEKEKRRIITAVNNRESESATSPIMELPTEGSREDLVWEESKDPIAITMAMLSLVAIVAVWVGMDKDLSKEYKKRNQSLSLEYSEFVSKLQLLISSGMTLRAAFEKMADDYSVKQNDEKKYVYEELLICVNRMKDGISESLCYEQFGNRCTLLKYRKLASLLIQNLKKGTKGLVDALSDETRTAFEERKSAARKMGEEAQTKLLFPMIMMLGVVMVIIMVPAYSSFGG